MAELKISQMTQATEEQLTDGALMEVAVEDGNSSTGYSTKSGSLARLKEYAIGELADELLANQNGGWARKNLLKNTAASTGNFTVNADGTVTVNGSFTSQTNLNIGTIRFDEDTRVTLNGAPAGGGTSSYALFISGKGTDSGSGATFTLNAGVTYTVVLRLYAGYTANNLVIKPMVRPATIEDGTYVPYAPSNVDLNEVDITSSVTNTDIFRFKVTKRGNRVFVYGQGENRSYSTNETLFTLPQEYRPSMQQMIPCTINVAAYGILSINTNGTVVLNQLSASPVSGRIYFSGSYLVKW